MAWLTSMSSLRNSSMALQTSRLRASRVIGLVLPCRRSGHYGLAWTGTAILLKGSCMPFFEVPGPQSTGLRLAYEVDGEGAPIVLVHGFASSRVTNWKSTSWYRALTEAGRQVIAMDVRGHGESDKPHDPAAYDEGELERDV